MNYLAHLYFAKPTVDSHIGNLLGDFRRGVDIGLLPKPVQLGLQNHYHVDKFTDEHRAIDAAKKLFNKSHRRFAPVALDIYFDHLLIKHWDDFSSESFEQFRKRSFSLLEEGLPRMPNSMQRSIGHMINHNWFDDYASEDGIARAIKNVAKRIRFENTFHQSVEDIQANKSSIETLFLAFFPELVSHISRNGPE